MRRDAVAGELPRLPLSYFHAEVPMPDGWATAPCAYVLLSEAYRHDAEHAADLGWPVTEILGSHLDLVTEPRKLAAALGNQAKEAGARADRAVEPPQG